MAGIGMAHGLSALLPFDLNLLVAFSVLFEERSVTRAALRLGVTQPTLSHSLAKLREALDDRLFVRSPGGMLPTPRASEDPAHRWLRAQRTEVAAELVARAGEPCARPAYR